MKQFGEYRMFGRMYGISEDEAKELLKKELHNLIDELCERDDFWIKKERDRTGNDILNQANTIAWKIAIPQMNDE